jgi:glycosyltransferase involved in cell wall biosynthesis
VIAFLNEERFLEEAVLSVLNQDYPNWELILVDDGSSDGSTAIARSYAERQPWRIHYLDHEGHRNLGLSPSRNAGVRAARGTLIALLDADDVWLPGKLSRQVEIFRSHPGIGMTVEASDYWGSWNSDGGEDRVVPVGAPAEEVYPPGVLSRILYPLGRGAAPCPCSVMMTRETWDNAGGFENGFVGDFALYEDQAFFSKVYLREQVFVSGACGNRYRQRAGSIVKAVQGRGSYHRVRRFFLEWFANWMQRSGLANAGVRQDLERALRPYRRPVRHYLERQLVRALRTIRRAGSRWTH